MNTISNHFIACEASFSDASCVLFGAGYDGTASFRPGSRFAPNAIREASDGIETFDPDCDADLEDFSIADVGDVDIPFGDRKKALAAIRETAAAILDAGKKFLGIGGEHLVSLPMVEAVREKYGDPFIIHFDAHADLREHYLGEPDSHATVMKRATDAVGLDRLFQYGIRSGTREEFALMRKHHTLERNIDEVIKIVKDAPVYISIDLDILDPSILPGTGTPEPGGWTYRELSGFLRKISGLNVVSMDVVELAPHYDASGVSTLVAAKLIRQMLLQYA